MNLAKSKLKTFFQIIVVLGFLNIHAQNNYKGILIDAKTNETIPYVNVGILGKGIGTVSDEEGKFHLNIDVSKYSFQDTLFFSSIGYREIKQSISDLQFVMNEYPIIEMKPDIVQLNEVVVTNRNNHKYEEKVGYRNYGEEVYGYWKEGIALGGELATKIKVKKGLRKLNELFFEVRSNPSDSVLIRVNIYDEDGNKKFPKTNLNTSGRSIFYTILSDTKQVKIDLTDYDIYVKNDFILSLELLQVYGDEPIGLILAASANSYTNSYTRYVSQDRWERKSNAAMAYSLDTTYFSKKNKGAYKVK